MPIDEHRQIFPSSFCTILAQQPFSSFDYVDTDFNSLNSLSRCFSLARSHEFQALTIEDIPAAGLVIDENTEIIAAGIRDHRMTSLKGLAFWSVPLESENDLTAAKDSDLIGFAILKKDEALSRNYNRWHIFEAVFRKYPHEHNCIPKEYEYHLRIGQVTRSIPGVLYCQQNTLNKACAHVALRSLLSRRLNDGDISYSTINRLAREEAGETGIKFYPGQGMNATQIRRVLSELNIPYRVIDYEEREKTEPDIRKELPFQKYIYAGIESEN